MLRYCEVNQIYDKLGNFGDFYYKGKKLLEDIQNSKITSNEILTPKQFIEAAEILKTDKKKAFVTAYVSDANYYNYFEFLYSLVI